MTTPKTDQPEYFERGRVDRLLGEAMKNSLVILSAGSGHGKTYALSSYLSHTNEQVIWLQFTELENYSSRFWERFSDALSVWNESLAATLRAEGFPHEAPVFYRFLERFSSAVYDTGRLILVFDDFHLLQEGEVHHFIQTLIQADIENLSIILIGANKVNVNVPGGVRHARLTDAQLRFTEEEIRVYYTALGVVVTDDLVKRIHRLTQGWAFAVYILGIHLDKHEPLREDNIDDAFAYLFRIIDEDFTSRYSPQTQHAICLLSTLDDFSLDMAFSLTGLSRQHLAQVLQTSPLIRYRPEHGAYYFHPLLRQFFEQKLFTVSKSITQAFLLGAAQWCESHDKPLQAARYYLQCDAYDDISRILLRLGEFQAPVDIANACLNMLDNLPDYYPKSRPMLVVIRAHMHYARGEARKARKLLLTLLEEWGERDHPDIREVLGEACVLLAVLALRRGSLKFVEYLRRADSCLPEGSTMVRPGTLFIGSGNALVFPKAREGAMDAFLDALFEAMPYADRVLHGVGQGRESLAAAEAAYYRMDLKRAQRRAYEAITKAQEAEQWDVVCNAHYLLMRVGLAQGRLPAMEENLEKMRQYATKIPAGQSFGLVDIAEIGYYIKAGLKNRVAKWIVDGVQHNIADIHLHAGREMVMTAGSLVVDHRYYEALAYTDQAMRACADTGQWFSRFKLHLLKALILNILEEYDDAAQCLRLAWENSHQNDIIMPFAEYGNHMRSLINNVRDLPGHGIPREWLDRVYTKANTYAKFQAALSKQYNEIHQVQPSPLDKLTRRELDILRMVCQGMRNEEIAESLDIHPSSVKGALNRIYPKIQAVNRADAVRIAINENIDKIN